MHFHNSEQYYISGRQRFAFAIYYSAYIYTESKKANDIICFITLANVVEANFQNFNI